MTSTTQKATERQTKKKANAQTACALTVYLTKQRPAERARIPRTIVSSKGRDSARFCWYRHRKRPAQCPKGSGGEFCRICAVICFVGHSKATVVDHRRQQQRRRAIRPQQCVLTRRQLPPARVTPEVMFLSRGLHTKESFCHAIVAVCRSVRGGQRSKQSLGSVQDLSQLIWISF